MRTVSIAACLALVALFASAAPPRDESVDGLKASIEAAPVQDRAELCIQLAAMQLRNADKFYIEGNIEKATAAVTDIVTYSERARDAARETRKRLKNVEIAVRKMADKLNDIKRTLSFEDQPAVEKAIQRLQAVRTDLLQEMFKKEKK